MEIRELPPEISGILAKVKAPPRLVAHLQLVYDVAVTMASRVEVTWPELVFDKEAVLIGGATHDIGKAIYPAELSGSGKNHEEIGPGLLQKLGLDEKYTRFARTHARWNEETENIGVEDLLVAWADKIWKGKRDETLEMVLCRLIAEKCREETWETYLKLDEIAATITKDADARLAWQAQYPIN
jgi:putative nucleotidyltransferase with HDIG domain